MSSNLCWEPIIDRHKTLGDSLKFILRDAYEFSGELVFNENQVPFLRGIAARTKVDEVRSDVKTLIEAIKKYGSVKLWEQY